MIGFRSATEFGSDPRPPDSEASRISSGLSPLVISHSAVAG